MSCSFCGSTNHNISKCQSCVIDRTMNIWNNNRDSFPRNLQAHWYRSHIADENLSSTRHPSDELWNYLEVKNRVRTTPIDNEVLSLLTHIWRMIHQDHHYLDHLVWQMNRGPVWYRFEKDSDVPSDNKITCREVGAQDFIRYRDNLISIQQRQRQRHRQEREERIRQMEIEQAARRRRRLRNQRQERIAEEERAQARRIEEERSQLVLVEKAIETDACPICMDTLGETNKSILRCGHQFCGDCIFTHFQNSGGTSCPCCRKDFATRVPNWLPPNSSDNQQDQSRGFQRYVRNIMDLPLHQIMNAIGQNGGLQS